MMGLKDLASMAHKSLEDLLHTIESSRGKRAGRAGTFDLFGRWTS